MDAINEPLNLGKYYRIDLDELPRSDIQIEQFIAALKTTTTLTDLCVDARIWPWPSTPENNHRFIETLCHCITNLRRHNQNHPLRKLDIWSWTNVVEVDKLLLAAKQFGIHHLSIVGMHLSIQSVVEFCRNNTHLKVLEIYRARFTDKKESAISFSSSPQNGPQDSSAILALDKLAMRQITFEDSTVATTFLSSFQHVTYTTLCIRDVTVRGDIVNEQESKILLELIKPSVQHLTLEYRCPMEIMDAIDACVTTTQIQLDDNALPANFDPAAVQEQLHAITKRNLELAAFVANPGAYPGDESLKLMSQCDNCPTGRYMLARSFPGISSFFKTMGDDSSPAGSKKRKRRY